MSAETSFQTKIVIETPEGLKMFDTKAEAVDFLRKPKILAALNGITGGNNVLADWLYEKQELLETIFETGTVRRVTKSERKQLAEALELVAAIFEGDKTKNKKLNFLVENAGAINETFRWPTVKRLKDDEKAAEINRSLMLAAENDEKLVAWLIESKDAIFEAYEAGKEKRQVSPQAAEGLAAYRAKKAAEKAAAEGNAPAGEATEAAPAVEEGTEQA